MPDVTPVALGVDLPREFARQHAMGLHPIPETLKGKVERLRPRQRRAVTQEVLDRLLRVWVGWQHGASGSAPSQDVERAHGAPRSGGTRRSQPAGPLRVGQSSVVASARDSAPNENPRSQDYLV